MDGPFAVSSRVGALLFERVPLGPERLDFGAEPNVLLVDPSESDSLVIPRSVIIAAWEEAQGRAAGTTRDSEQAAGQPYLWLFATADAGTWLVEDLGRGPDGSNGPILAAANGATVLVGTPGGEPGSDIWQRFAITE